MAETKGDPRDQDAIPMAGFEVLPPQEERSHVPAQINITQRFVTAQVVQNPRRIPAVVGKLREMAMVGSERFYYRWEVKNNDGTKKPVEGLSIKGANSLAMIYGNCSIDVDGRETETHYYIKATFIDLETGANMTREFRQRKTMNLGKRMDKDRAEDIAFQIGQSKAIRNVITNALDPFAAEMLEFAQKGVLARINANPEKALAWIIETAGSHNVSLQRLELYVARPKAEWVAAHLAKLYGALNALEDGMDTANNIFAEGAAPEVKVGETIEGGTVTTGTPQGGKAEGEKGRGSSRKAATKADEKKEPEKPKEPDKAAAAQQGAAAQQQDKGPAVQNDDLASMAGFDGSMD